jgi:hypothetical protein
MTLDREEVRQRAIFLLARERCVRLRLAWLAAGIVLGVAVHVIFGS